MTLIGNKDLIPLSGLSERTFYRRLKTLRQQKKLPDKLGNYHTLEDSEIIARELHFYTAFVQKFITHRNAGAA